MASGSPEDREKAYLRKAISLLQSPCQDSDVVPRIVLLQACISTLQASSALKKLEADGFDLASLKNHLLRLSLPVITSKKQNGKALLALLITLEALSSLDRDVVRQALSDAVPALLETSDALLGNGVKAGWEVRMFLANHFPEALPSPLVFKMSVETSAATEEEDGPVSGESAATLGKTALLRYVDAVIRSADEETKLGYLEELLRGDSDDKDAISRLLVIYRLIQHLKGKTPQVHPS
jgi:nucleolar pre-ribosomal-associated protein 2